MKPGRISGMAAVGAIAPFVMGCSVADPPTAAPSPAPSPSPTPWVTPPVSAVPILDADAWEPFGEPIAPGPTTTASVQRSGVRLTVGVETNPLLAHGPSWIVTTVENVGTNPVHWSTDDCGISVHVDGRSAVAWVRGVRHVGPAEAFKDALLRLEPGTTEPPLRPRLTPERLVGGDVECANVGAAPQSLAPGQQLVERTRWEGDSVGGSGLFPGTPVQLRAAFASAGWSRGNEAQQSREAVTVDLPIALHGGRDPQYLSPGQAIDAALQSNDLRAFVEAYPSPETYEELILVADDDTASWRVGARTDDGHGILVLVDGLLGWVLEVAIEP